MLLGLVACGFTPTAAPGGIQVRDLTLEGATVDVAIDVHNPWPATADVDVDWAFTLGEASLSAGTVTGLAIGPSDDTALHLPLALRWADLYALTGSIGRPVPYRIDLTLRGHTVLGAWTVPVHTEGTLEAPSWPDITWVDWRIDTLSTQQAAATLVLDVANTAVLDLDWTVTVGTVPLAHGRLDRAEDRVELPIVVELGRSWEALQTVAVVGLGLTVKGHLDSPLGPLPVHLDRSWRPGE